MENVPTFGEGRYNLSSGTLLVLLVPFPVLREFQDGSTSSLSTSTGLSDSHLEGLGEHRTGSENKGFRPMGLLLREEGVGLIPGAGGPVGVTGSLGPSFVLPEDEPLSVKSTSTSVRETLSRLRDPPFDAMLDATSSSSLASLSKGRYIGPTVFPFRGTRLSWVLGGGMVA